MGFQEDQKALSAENEKAGTLFLEENAKRPEVTSLPSGLQYSIQKEGNGTKPGPKSRVTVHYEGSLINGKVFDSSFKRNQPATFGLNQVITGWTEGLQLMSEGARYTLYLPHQLGYGASGAGGAIPPYSALIFDVELIRVG